MSVEDIPSKLYVCDNDDLSGDPMEVCSFQRYPPIHTRLGGTFQCHYQIDWGSSKWKMVSWTSH